MYIERHIQPKAQRITEVIPNFMVETWTQLAFWKPPDLLAGWWGTKWISFCIQKVWLLDGIFNFSKNSVFKKERCILITLIMLSFIKSYITKCHHHSKAVSQEIFRHWGFFSSRDANVTSQKICTWLILEYWKVQYHKSFKAEIILCH